MPTFRPSMVITLSVLVAFQYPNPAPYWVWTLSVKKGHRAWKHCMRLFLNGDAVARGSTSEGCRAEFRCGAADGAVHANRGEHGAAGNEAVHGHENVRELLKVIDEQFVTSDKALENTLIMKFTSLKFTGIKYEHFKISYNTRKDKWSINELMTMCVQEEERLMMEQGESVMLVTQKKEKKGKSQAS
ncbi:hypothetical protein CK203_080346 [Vitis vinifera]|uniref:Uncharacterized protein n=1 Tax=Vitis vinifera TaxID=29760 RepID=A0A438CNU8_VITVI|nr:hypothetical protein CK203_080346 [Vitis vinifera]